MWFLLRAKDPKVQHAQVCIMVVGLYFKGLQVANTGPWMRWYDRSARVQDTSGDNERCRGESRRCSRRLRRDAGKN